jgi:hypothetical protein
MVAVIALSCVSPSANASNEFVDRGIATLRFVKAVEASQAKEANSFVGWIEKSQNEDTTGQRVGAEALIQDIQGCSVWRANILDTQYPMSVIWKCPGQTMTLDRVYACRNDGCNKEVWATIFTQNSKLLVRYYLMARERPAVIQLPSSQKRGSQ